MLDEHRRPHPDDPPRETLDGARDGFVDLHRSPTKPVVALPARPGEARGAGRAAAHDVGPMTARRVVKRRGIGPLWLAAGLWALGPSAVRADEGATTAAAVTPESGEESDAHAGSQREAIEAAIDEGYARRPDDEPAGSLLGGMIALVPGFLLHGLGHYYVGEHDTGLDLLLAQGLGLGLIAASMALGNLTRDSGESGAPRRLLMHSGILLFAGSWTADIIGAFKGAASFAPDNTRTNGTLFALGYRYANDPLTPFSNQVVVRLSLDNGRVYVKPMTHLEVALRTRSVNLDTGVRLFRGENPHNQVALGVRLRQTSTPEYGLGTRGYSAYTASKVDLGLLVRSLRNFYVVNRVGVGVEQYQLGDSVGQAPSPFAEAELQDRYLYIESGFEVNTGQRTHASLRYIQDPSHEMAPASNESGLFEVGLVHRYHDDLDIEFSVLGGQGWAVWAALAYGL